MCVIAVKPKGIDMPTDAVLQQMWTTNKDGAGFMYNDGGRVHIKKGFMTFDDFKRNLQNTYDDLTRRAINLKEDVAFVYHFRIATHGTVVPENTHPFPVSNDIAALKALDLTTDLGMAHNGIIRSLDNDETNNLTDTATFVKDVLVPFKAFFTSAFLQLANITKFIGNTINASRLAFLDGAGNVTKIGSWSTGECQLDYSNKNHVPYKPTYAYNPKGSSIYDDEDDLYARYGAYSYSGAKTTKPAKPTYLPACVVREIDTKDVLIKLYAFSATKPHIVKDGSGVNYYLTHDSSYVLSSYIKIDKWDTNTVLTVYDVTEFELTYGAKHFTYGDMELLDMGKPYSVEGFKTTELIPDNAFLPGTLSKSDLTLKQVPSKGYTMYDTHTDSYFPDITRGSIFLDAESTVYYRTHSGRFYLVKEGIVMRDYLNPQTEAEALVTYETLVNVTPEGEAFPVKPLVFKGVPIYE